MTEQSNIFWKAVIRQERDAGRLVDITIRSVNWIDGTHDDEIAEKCSQIHRPSHTSFMRDVIAGAIAILDDEFVASMQNGRD